MLSSSYADLPGIDDRGLQQLPKEIDIVFIVGFPQKAAHRSLRVKTRWSGGGETGGVGLRLLHLAVASRDTACLKARERKPGGRSLVVEEGVRLKAVLAAQAS